jgi:hypothetical protein
MPSFCLLQEVPLRELISFRVCALAVRDGTLRAIPFSPQRTPRKTLFRELFSALSASLR